MNAILPIKKKEPRIAVDYSLYEEKKELVRKLTTDIVREQTIKQINLTPFEINLVLATTLRDMDWEADEIIEFIKHTGRIQDYFNNRYDDDDLFAMDFKLKEIGVDIKGLLKELDGV